MQRRTIALILLVVVALWGGIAYLNPILNPVHVDAARADRGTLFPTVKGTGQVTPKGLTSVQAPASAKVLSVTVSLGQEVKKGDELMTIEIVSAEPTAPPTAPAPATPSQPSASPSATTTPGTPTPRPEPPASTPPPGPASPTPAAPSPTPPPTRGIEPSPTPSAPPTQTGPSPTPSPPPTQVEPSATPPSPSGQAGPSPTPSPAVPAPSATPPPSSSYTVQPGDTLGDIARRNGTTVEEIARSNGISNPDLIFPGQQLSIPNGRPPQGGFPGAPPLIGAMIVSSITSPIDGQVMKLEAKAGQTVTSGANLATVADTSTIFLEMLANQEGLKDLAKGQSAQIIFDALPKETVRGKVEEIGSTPVTTAPGVSGYPVKVTLEAPPKGVRLGMAGQAEIITKQLSNVLFVPKRSVFEQNGEAYVFVVEDNRVTKTVVSVGQKTRDYYEIRSGLSEGQTIVASNLEEMYDGLRVSVDKILGPK